MDRNNACSTCTAPPLNPLPLSSPLAPTSVACSACTGAYHTRKTKQKTKNRNQQENVRPAPLPPLCFTLLPSVLLPLCLFSSVLTVRWIFASGRGQNEVLGRNLSPLTSISKVCFYAVIIIINDVVCPPWFSGRLNLFISPQYFYFSFFVLFLLYIYINTNDIQLNARSIAVGSQLPGRTWLGVLEQKFYALNQGKGEGTGGIRRGETAHTLWSLCAGQSGRQCSVVKLGSCE